MGVDRVIISLYTTGCADRGVFRDYPVYYASEVNKLIPVKLVICDGAEFTATSVLNYFWAHNLNRHWSRIYATVSQWVQKLLRLLRACEMYRVDHRQILVLCANFSPFCVSPIYSKFEYNFGGCKSQAFLLRICTYLNCFVCRSSITMVYHNVCNIVRANP